MPILLGPAKSHSRLVPVAPLRDGVIFPHTEVVLTFGRPKSVKAVEAAFTSDRLLCLVTQKRPAVNEPEFSDVYPVGTLVRIERLLRTDGELNVLVRGLARVKLEELTATAPFWIAKVTEIPEVEEKSDEVTALCKHLTSQLKKAVNLGKSVDFLVLMRLMSGVSPAELADQLAVILDIKTAERIELLRTPEVKKRLQKISELLAHELKVLEIEHSIASKTQKKFDRSIREAVLRERMRTIQKELGETEEDKEIAEFRKKIKAAKMPPAVEQKALKELKRLSKLSPHNPEAGYIRTYLEWLTEMPWSVRTPNNVSIRHAQKVLEEDHYGLKNVKERILEYLAVMKLKQKKAKQTGKKAKKEAATNASGPTILCFVGAPGVGKTSIGKSIARALGRKFIRISLGGIRDEAEIRGHRRTYVGALPGRIIQGIKNAGTKNPVFMLDEIDKIGKDFRGDPSAALLEALDPEQNSQFSDHYLEVPFDLSEVMFITTANVLDTIPPALRDRLEIIRFSGYTEDEKFQIAKKYLIKKTLLANALEKDQVKITDAALRRIIRRYTREAGVRNLEREISKIMRKVARQIAAGKKTPATVTVKNLADYLGPPKYSDTVVEKKDEVGLATGLAWTQAGGEILFIEVSLMPGKGKVILTGQLGDVMKESCQAAISYVRSRWQQLKLAKNFAQHLDFHIHVPEGAVPKDGPSAGIAIAVALISALTKRKVNRLIGLTGEITLRGRVLEIGGVKEKVIAAHRAGLKAVILPKENKKDLVDIPAKVKKDIRFHFVSHMDEVLRLVFTS